MSHSTTEQANTPLSGAVPQELRLTLPANRAFARRLDLSIRAQRLAEAS